MSRNDVAGEHDVEREAMIPTTVMNAAKKVSAFLDEHGVPHAVAGGMALSAHGHARVTMNVDILVPSSAVMTIELWARPPPSRASSAESPFRWTGWT